MGDNIPTCWNCFSKTKTKRSTSITIPKVSSSMDKGYVVENHLKHQSDFFKKTRDTNLLSIALDYHCLKTSQGGGN